MWKRYILKEEARNSLKRFGYWMPLLVTFVCGIITGGISTGGTTTSSVTTNYTAEYGGKLTPEGFLIFIEDFLGDFYYEISAELESFLTNPLIALTTIFFIVLGFAIGLVLTFGWSAFISGPIIVGKNRYFMEHRAFNSKFERIFWSFKSGRYMNVVKIMFWREIKIFLWTLLFIIPGIIKSYEYSMVPYILSENPNISSERAFELSKQMTKGEKWKIFMLDLSFLGWRILGVLCCCVGQIFVEPYYEATFAELYQVMREKAHGLGFTNYDELCGFYPEEA
ncbi:MAG: DUF975 family protein [Oscillospiraceae bacterium]|nr:DUF975 family protein [Oscillospiraceae bacterium]